MTKRCADKAKNAVSGAKRSWKISFQWYRSQGLPVVCVNPRILNVVSTVDVFVSALDSVLFVGLGKHLIVLN